MTDLRALAEGATPGRAPNVPGCSCDRDDETVPGVLCQYHERIYRGLTRNTLAMMLVDVDAAMVAHAAFIAAASPEVVLALLAEVDRLTTAIATELVTASMERARIRAAVGKLRVRDKAKGENDYFRGYRDSRNETVAAVLAIVEGENRPESVREAAKRRGIPLPSEDIQQRRIDEVTRKPMPGDMDDD